jgi:hypothetical protein
MAEIPWQDGDCLRFVWPEICLALRCRFLISILRTMPTSANLKIGLVLLCLSLGFSAARAAIVTLIPSEDSMISENDPSLTQGTATTINSGTTGPNEGSKRNRALLKFDLTAGIPSNATVTSASLKLTITATPPSSTNLWFSLHTVFQDWAQNTVTWTNRLSPPAPWSVPGGAPPVDYSSSVSQSNLITGVGSFTFASSPAMVADLQAWVSNPTSNFGWILICEQEDLEKSVRKFVSRESATAGNRPSLVVQFTAPPVPPTLSLLGVTNNQFQFVFNAESNRTYSVEYIGDLSTTNWMVLTNVSALPTATSVLVSDSPLLDSGRFYRVRTP